MGLFDFLKNKILVGSDNPIFSKVVTAALAELKRKNLYYHSIKTTEYEAYKLELMTLMDKEKVQFIVGAVKKIHAYHKGRSSFRTGETDWQLVSIAERFLGALMKTKLLLDDEDIRVIVDAFIDYPRADFNKHILYWPVNLLVGQVEKLLKERPLTDALKDTLIKLKIEVNKTPNTVQEKEQLKIIDRLTALIGGNNSVDTPETIKTIYFPGDDEFGKFANNTINKMPDDVRLHWFKLMAMAQKSSGSKPTNKYLDQCNAIIKELGNEKFKKHINEWFEFLQQLKDSEQEKTYRHNDYVHNWTSTEFISTPNADILKGFVWMSVHFHDKVTVFNVAMLADRAFRKIPGKGAAAPALGNACLYTLANSKGLDGVGHLSRLRLRIQQSSTQAIIEKYLNEAANKQGVSVHEIEDLAVSDYELTEGKREYEFDDYKAVLEIEAIGKVNVNWFKPDGSPQKSVPAFVKDSYAPKLKKLKDTAKQIELTLSAQRDRFDRMFKADRQLTWDKFIAYYFAHGLMSFITKKLIWNIRQNDTSLSVFFHDGKWVNNKGEAVDIDGNVVTAVSLWHPVFSTVEEVRQWREFMLERNISQPLKQAFREVYLLTDAELNTRTYSNRMAAHLLKQHQFSSLAKIRGWKFTLMGSFDNGADGRATLLLPDYNIRAEYWTNEVNAEDAMSDTGIWLYVSTDQVRFVNLETHEVMELINVPKMVLSEVLRDVDLFVGVASVGNDPNWRDNGGLPAYRDYWQAYSFGDLTEVAKTRRLIFERLLPRLKIAKVAEIRDKFLVVKGKLRTYKIHFGSTNILMEPNDQYLCIVPDRSQKDISGNVFLPFEGDNGLSVIISKALLLAEDDKITDTTITRQIKL